MAKKQSFSLKTLIVTLVAAVSCAALLPCSAMAETTDTPTPIAETTVEAAPAEETTVEAVPAEETTTETAPVAETAATPIVVSPTHDSTPYDIAVGEIIGGSLLAAVGLGMAIPALAVDEKANTLWDRVTRRAVGASGGVAFILGAVVIGVASYELHQIKKTDGSTVSMTVAPTLGGAMFNMEF